MRKEQKSKKSLNYEKRLRDHKNIIMENQAMLRRLQGKHSNFDVIKWHREEAERKKLLTNLRRDTMEAKRHDGHM